MADEKPPYEEWLDLMMNRRKRKRPAMTREEKNARRRARYRLNHPPQPPGPYGRWGKTREEHSAYLRAWKTAHRDEVNRKTRERYDTDADYRAYRVQISQGQRDRKRAKSEPLTQE